MRTAVLPLICGGSYALAARVTSRKPPTVKQLEDKLRVVDAGLRKIANGKQFSISTVMDAAAPLLEKLDKLLAHNEKRSKTSAKHDATHGRHVCS